jgi:hypothetical protein
MLARIYIPARNAMQSGKANTKEWVLEFEPASARTPDPLMGWTVTGDMRGQVRMLFDTREEAIAYAQRHGIPFEVQAHKTRRPLLKAYADNFAFTRKEPWTH